MKKIWIPISVFAVVGIYLIVSVLINNSEIRAKNELASGKIDSLTTITLSFVGDLMCHSTQFNYARVDNDSFDFNPFYREISKYLSSSDFTIGNLETVTAGKSEGYSGYPFFNTPDEYITALKYAGIDLLVTANNHSLDKGEKGVLRTIEQIERNSINRVGTFSSEADRDSIRIFDINGITVAILSYTYGTNGIEIPKGKDYIVNLIDYDLIRKDIISAKEKGADIIIPYYHFGDEYKRLPNKFQEEVVEKTVEFGADIIIGSHPHVIQPVRYFKSQNAKLDSGFIAYSLGNFFSNQRWRYSDAGIILNLILAKNVVTDSVYISEVNYIPTWVFRGETSNGKEYLILPAEKHDDSLYYFLNPEDRRLMEQAFADTKSIITEYTNKIKLTSIR